MSDGGAPSLRESKTTWYRLSFFSARPDDSSLTVIISLEENPPSQGLVAEGIAEPSSLILGCLAGSFLFIGLEPGLREGLDDAEWADGALFEVAVDNPNIGLDDAWRSTKWYWYEALARFFHEEPSEFMRVLRRAETVQFYVIGNGGLVFPKFDVQRIPQTEAQDLIDACPARRFRLDGG